ncbi:MAG: type II toxin-antitoxin system HicB family antitoxin [Prevotella sp.]|nr:type II toxin-antitoxin system HicB family antitoxin [Prevotella sp.]MBR0276429.1 type II toxin-antitoxin system HicB family antitoxin [Prevotella sp.]
MGYLKYKGYTGSVDYSEEDNCLFGKVQGMTKESITYEGSSLEELTEDFHGAVDDYLSLCKEKGIEPRKPYTGVLNVRLTPEIHSGAAAAAQREGVSINSFIKNAVARALGIAL